MPRNIFEKSGDFKKNSAPMCKECIFTKVKVMDEQLQIFDNFMTCNKTCLSKQQQQKYQ